MPQTGDFTEYALLAQLRTPDIQNPQELAAIWGPIQQECSEVGAEIIDSYASLGQYDFLIILNAPSRDICFKASMIMERHGLDVQTMELMSTDAFGAVVEDI